MGVARGVVTGELGCENGGGERIREEAVDIEREPRERREA